LILKTNRLWTTTVKKRKANQLNVGISTVFENENIHMQEWTKLYTILKIMWKNCINPTKITARGMLKIVCGARTEIYIIP
jgi:hypothetical protein